MSADAESPTGGRNKRIAWFAFWNLLSFAAMFAIFFAVRDIEWWDGAFRASFRFFYQHETVAVMAAMTPFLASLLVGWGYAQRARRRRARQAALASRAVEEGPVALME